MNEAPVFEDFWTASELSPLNRRAFFDRIASFDAAEPELDPWSRTAAPDPAERLTGDLAGALAARRSDRRFAAETIQHRDLGRLLSVLAAGPADGSGRGHPAAGGLYAVRAISLVFSADRQHGRVLQHDPIGHTLTDIGACAGWADLVDDLAGQDAETPPAAMVGLYADTNRLLAKYGERGGRFLLLEAGAALQSLTLAAADLGLVGYPCGGAADASMLALAGLTGRGARYVVGYAVGHRDRGLDIVGG